MEQVCVILVLVAVCSAKSKMFSPQSRIVGGFEVVPNSLPYQASILYLGSHVCGGALIAPSWVLTAAHCNKDVSQLTVILGSHKRLVFESMEQTLSVALAVKHPDFNEFTLSNDLLLLKLKTPAQMTYAVQLVSLSDRVMAPGTMCSVSGWGVTAEGSNDLSSVLMAVLLPIVDPSLCNATYGGQLVEGMLCAGYVQGGKDSCQGDSGGPLVCRNKLVGVVSWGEGCARPRYYGVYTSVARYLPWIRNTMAVARDYKPRFHGHP